MGYAIPVKSPEGTTLGYGEVENRDDVIRFSDELYHSLKNHEGGFEVVFNSVDDLEEIRLINPNKESE
jgi:hypothetical protein